MHNPTRFRATFRDLIVTAFDREQTLKLRIEVIMFQASNSPERWTFTPVLPTGRPHLDAPSAKQLAQRIEEIFVERLTPWTQTGTPQKLPRPSKSIPGNVIEMRPRRSA